MLSTQVVSEFCLSLNSSTVMVSDTHDDGAKTVDVSLP